MLARLTSLLGIVVILAVLYMLSDNKKSINKKTIAKALGIQIVLGWLLVSFPIGRFLIEQIANVVSKVFGYGMDGISFVFGDLAGKGVFAIDVLGGIIFLSGLTGILNHYGIIQWFVKVVGGAVGNVLGTEKAESFVAVANMLLGQTESPFLIAEYIPKMTKSELMVVLVSGMGSMSASILVGYAGIGISMKWLLITTALVPLGSLMVAKILTPETEESQVKDVTFTTRDKDANVFASMANGFSNGLQMSLGIGASLIAVLGLIALINGGLSLVGLSLETILGYVFLPLGLLFGLPFEEALTAGQLLGIKFSANEFVSFAQLSPLFGTLSERAEAMLSVAIGSFGALSSIAICLTGLSVFAPERKNDISKLSLRACIGGFLVPVISAMVVGLFI